MYESRKMRATIFMVLTAIITASLLHAQSTTLDQATRRAVIERVLKEIAAGYIYSGKAPDIAREIHKHEGEGAYDTASGEEFARRLTKDLQSAAHDLHFEVDYSSDLLPQEPTASAAPTREERFDAGKDNNYGFRKIEILKEMWDTSLLTPFIVRKQSVRRLRPQWILSRILTLSSSICAITTEDAQMQSLCW